MRCAVAGACALTLSPIEAEAGPAASVTMSGAIERHWTSNALDSEFEIPDWYTLLRGSLNRKWDGDDASAAVGAEFQATRHDAVRIEDDRAAALSAELFRRLPGGVELRGTLNYRASSEGDDLQIGPLALGTRTLKQVAGAGVQIGIDLGNATSLILEAADSFEAIGATRFQHDILPATRLDPNRNSLKFALQLTRTLGAFAFGGSASALLVSVERLGIPPVALSFAQYGLRGEAAFKGTDGSALGLALGAEWLGDRDGFYNRIRPAWQVAVTKPLPRDLELRASFFGRYETADSDDPLASWLRHAEVEIGWKPLEHLALATGIACQVKENLLFENEERTRSLYMQAAYETSAAAALVFRVDFSKTFKTVIDVRQTTFDAFAGLRLKI